jgi:endonuclease/exonuclease/phosphatase (EEP) superfamily protein YafD
VIAALTVVSGAPYAVFFARGRWYDYGLLGALALSLGWQLWNILPYTPLAKRAVEEARRRSPETALRLLISNLLQGNRQHERWLAVARGARPDLIVALEVDAAWDQQLRSLEGEYPHGLRHPLENCYGMAVLSRLPLRDARVEFLVQDDIPSIHAIVELPGGAPVWLHALHPRPPEPVTDQDSAARDAELMKMARRIRAAPARPTVVAGDLNDVAWSHTTQLFLRESGLLDPRLGRGFFNTFDANRPLFRFPLDHVFHSRDFRLVDLRRMGHVGSDHFPVLIELSLEPEAAAAQRAPAPTESDERGASEMIARGERERSARDR